MADKLTFFYMWKAVRCSKVDGRKFLGLYQGDLGLCHVVWNGDHQILIKPEIGDIMVDATEEEEKELQAQIEAIFKKQAEPIPASKAKPTPQSTYKVTETKVEPPKPKVMSDFEILTADIETI